MNDERHLHRAYILCLLESGITCAALSGAILENPLAKKSSAHNTKEVKIFRSMKRTLFNERSSLRLTATSVGGRLSPKVTHTSFWFSFGAHNAYHIVLAAPHTRRSISERPGFCFFYSARRPLHKTEREKIVERVRAHPQTDADIRHTSVCRRRVIYVTAADERLKLIKRTHFDNLPLYANTR